jgi:hypothetical protein
MQLSRFRPRFTVRWLMVAVAIMAVVIAGQRMWRHRSKCIALAAKAGNREQNFRSRGLDIARDPSMANSKTVSAILPDGNGIVEFRVVGRVRRAFYPQGATQPADAETVEKLAKWCRDVADRSGELRRKYERAARYPWLPVAPDPPEPE